MKQTYIVKATTIVESINNIVKAITSIVCANPDNTYSICFDELKTTRTIEQNSKLHAMLHDIASQVDWVVDGKETKLTDEEWKDLLTASQKREMRVAKGIDGGIVLLGKSTKKMSVAEMSDLIELMYMFGAEHDVVWRKHHD